jgi:hypothetical protein
MVTLGDGRVGAGSNHNPNITDLMRWLNLMEEEEAVADFTDDEGDKDLPSVEWALVGKELSPTPVHVNTIRLVMKPTWGNPFGLKF